MLYIEWTVEHQQCEVRLLACTNDNYCKVWHTIAVEVPAREVWVIIRNGLLSALTSPHRLDIFFACTVSIVGEPVAWMVNQPRVDCASLLGTQRMAGKHTGIPDWNQRSKSHPNQEIHSSES